MGFLINTRRYTLVQGFCFFWLFLMGCKELTGTLLPEKGISYTDAHVIMPQQITAGRLRVIYFIYVT